MLHPCSVCSADPSFSSAASSPCPHAAIAIEREPLSQVDVSDKALQQTHHHFGLIGDGPLGAGGL